MKQITRYSFLITLCWLLSISLAAAMDQGDYCFHRMPETSYYGGINCITKDAYGRIWFTGTDALYMYDAVSYHHISLPNPSPGRMMNFTSVKSLPDGSLLVSTNVGLYSYDFRKEEFQLECSGSAGYMETEYKDQVWLMMNDTLSLYKGNGQVESYPFPPEISSLGGGRYYGCHSTPSSIYVSKGNNLFRYDPDSGEFSHFVSVPDNVPC